MADTVLAHLASFTSQKENVATEALAFIANRSATARGALAGEISRLTGRPISIGYVKTQMAAGKESRPDIALVADRGLVGFVEAKFWAPLTSSQPVEYLRRLADIGGGTLIMLAPSRRLASLRAEVQERCHRVAHPLDPVDLWTFATGPNYLVLLSWRSLLDALARATTGEPATASDIGQLDGLCQRFESEGFIPLTQEELDDLDTPRRVGALAGLVNDIVDHGVASRILDTTGVRRSDSADGIGRYAKMPRAGCWIGLSFWEWSRRGRSPIWLRFSRSWGRADQLRGILQPWAALNPPLAYLDSDDGAVCVPLLLRTVAEKATVVEHAVEQIGSLDALMQKGGMTVMESAAPPDP